MTGPTWASNVEMSVARLTRATAASKLDKAYERELKPSGELTVQVQETEAKLKIARQDKVILQKLDAYNIQLLKRRKTQLEAIRRRKEELEIIETLRQRLAEAVRIADATRQGPSLDEGG